MFACAGKETQVLAMTVTPRADQHIIHIDPGVVPTIRSAWSLEAKGDALPSVRSDIIGENPSDVSERVCVSGTAGLETEVLMPPE